jgi:hypothetical protein
MIVILCFHLSKIGKELLANQVVSHIFSLLEKVNSMPIALGWCDKETQVNVTLAAKPPQPHKNCQLETEQTIKRNRKLLITRKDDFLWEIYLRNHNLVEHIIIIIIIVS